jgi:hypothetical protein
MIVLKWSVSQPARQPITCSQSAWQPIRNDEGTSLTLSSAGKGSVTAEWRAGQGRQQVDVLVWGSKGVWHVPVTSE